ncbi:MAG: hypothetical protein JWN71_72 [Xanthobacteraceae bacterium]|nr:hypothetical protein [Xanthobacteraceae bacterium]
MGSHFVKRLVFALLLTAYADAASAQTFMDKTKRDEGIRVPQGDVDMAAAFRKAKATLKDFLEIVRADRPSVTSYSVKIALREGNVAEYVWISPFVERNGNFIGLVNSTLRAVRKVKSGQKITFHESEVVDWLYRENGKMIGNFTVCALLKREPPEQAAAFRKEHGLDCSD